MNAFSGNYSTNLMFSQLPYLFGLLQGSILGPILFIIFTNEKPKIIKDDATTFMSDSI